jgi:hypothetical protein
VYRALFPNVLYRRVRAVFETFGPQLEEKTEMPLFNDAAWFKADGVLSVILDGFSSDPPDENFYFYQLSALKEIKRDNLGIPLIRCTRDIKTPSNAHTSGWSRCLATILLGSNSQIFFSPR